MSELFKNKYKLLALLTTLMLVVTLAAGSFAYGANAGLLSEPGLESSQPDSSGEEPTEEEQGALAEEEAPVAEFRSPSNMKGVFLSAGTDYNPADGEDAVKGQIDDAMDKAQTLGMNTVILGTNYEDKVVYRTVNAPTLSGSFDVMEYMVSAARERDFYLYAIFDVSHYKATPTTRMTVTAGELNTLASDLGEFAEKYALDGILVDGYTNERSQDSYSLYTLLGGGIGYDNYLRTTPEALVSKASEAIHGSAPSTQVGLLADPVWANAADREEGSATEATFTSLIDGNADTKSFVEKGLVDFLAVKAFASIEDKSVPFSEIVRWWADVARGADMPLYIVQASSMVGAEDSGWSAEELAKQMEELEYISGVRGSAFDSLKVLSEDEGGLNEALQNAGKPQIEPEKILQELEMTKPSETTYTTAENQVVFAGASDPEEPVTINGETVATDASGYFTATFSLKAGQNNFVIAHKERTINYAITRQVEILKEISPTGSISTDGGMEIAIIAWAYDGAEVYATVNGTTVPMAPDDNVIDEEVRDSSYKRFTGTYTAPGATDQQQSLGAITVQATYEGQSKSLTGASVTVNKKAKVEDGTPVVVVTDQAMTYPASTLDNIPRADCYPLPKGAMDYAVGEEIEYKSVGYTVLASGLRVKSSDIQGTSDFASANTVSKISVDVKDGFTYITLKTAQKVSYNVDYTGSAFKITLNYTNNVPEGMTLNQNPIFTDASWDSSTLVLSMVKQGGFMGYKGYYDDGGNLVFRFNNPPSSIAGARIVIDPGHGGRDVGALGFLADYSEKVINSLIADALAEELQSRGATVLLLNTSGGMDLATRVSKAEQFNADIFVSIHNNTASNTSAQGTEVYYFYPFSKSLAAGTSSGVSSQLGTNNRGARQSYYTVSLSSQFSSALVECGFMSNKDEYEKLVSGKYQSRIAVGIADGISSAIKNSYTGIDGGGSQSGGSVVTDGESSQEESSSSQDPSSESSAGNTAATGITMNRDTLTLKVGRTGTVKGSVQPDTASNRNVTYTSSDASIVEVDGSGKVTALKSGEATITATTADGGFKATCKVTVLDDGDSSQSSSGEDIPVDDLQLSDSQIDIEIGEEYSLDAVVYPTDASNQKIHWESDDTAVATVNGGKVTGVKDGVAVISATSDDGGITVTCTVYVGTGSGSGSSGGTVAKDVEWIDIECDTLTMYINATQTMRLVDDKDRVVANSALKWKSSDTSILKVDENGVVTAKSKAGTATIEAYITRSGDIYASVNITVTRDKVAVTGVTLSHSSLELQKGVTTDMLKATLSPSTATNKELVWRSSNENVVTVDSAGKLTAKNRGTAMITLRTKDGNFTARCEVTVVREMEIEDLYLDVAYLEMWIGDTDTLTVYFDPEGYPNQAVTWTSSNPSVVSVDSKGNVKALKKGTATITVTAKADTACTYDCEITVYND